MVMVPNNFSINIARHESVGNGMSRTLHFAAVELGQLLEPQARAKCAEFVARFPDSEGWRITLSKITCYGQEIAIN